MHACTLMDLFLLKGNASQPVDTAALIAQGKNAMMIAKVTVVALETFQKGELKQFDALGGEEACQLRAKKIVDLYESRGSLVEIPHIMEVATQVIEGDQPFDSLNKVMTPDIHFIVLAYLLTQTKKEVEKPGTFLKKDITDYKLLQETYQVGEKQIKKITRAARKQLAFLSVEYVQSLRRKLYFRRELPVEEYGDLKLKCVPCFDTIETLLQSMLVKDQKLLIEAQLGKDDTESCGKLQLLYRPNLARTGFEPLREELDPKTPVVVFAGNSLNDKLSKDTIDAFKDQLLGHLPEELILYNAAQHSAYPGGYDIKKTPRRSYYAENAKRLGCTKVDKRLFTVDHIYASTVGKEFETC